MTQLHRGLINRLETASRLELNHAYIYIFKINVNYDGDTYKLVNPRFHSN